MVNATNNDLYHNSLVKDSPNIVSTNGTMELSNNTSALIDKIHIKNVVVTDVKDVCSLRDRDILIVKEGKSNYLFNERGEGYSSISISDANNFDKFDYYLTRWGHISSNMQISIDDPEYRNLNCYSVEDYKDRLVAIQEELLCNYGISVSFENAEIEYIEINKTIVLNTFYEDYLRILKLLVSLFPRRLRLRTNGEFEKYTKNRRLTEIEKLTETYSRSSGKRGISIEIYNKTDELYERYNITLMYNYLRFEIKLNSSDKIKKELGTNVLQHIDDDMINSYFSRFIIDNVEKPYSLYCEDRDKKIKKILKETYRPKSTTWIRDSIIKICGIEIGRQIPLMINIGEVTNLLDCLPFSSRQCKYSAKRNFETIADESIKSFIKMDTKAYMEIIQKLK